MSQLCASQCGGRLTFTLFEKEATKYNNWPWILLKIKKFSLLNYWDNGSKVSWTTIRHSFWSQKKGRESFSPLGKQQNIFLIVERVWRVALDSFSYWYWIVRNFKYSFNVSCTLKGWIIHHISTIYSSSWRDVDIFWVVKPNNVRGTHSITI